jgi:hypothetical protein
MTNPIIQYSVLNSWFLSVSVTMYHIRIALKKAKLIAILRYLYLQCQRYEQRVSSKHWNLSGSRIHGCTISLRFLGIILGVLRGFRIQCLHYKPVSNQFWGEEWRTVSSGFPLFVDILPAWCIFLNQFLSRICHFEYNLISKSCRRPLPPLKIFLVSLPTFNTG